MKANSANSQTKCASAFQLTLNEVMYFNEVRDYLRTFKAFQYAIACKERAPTTEHEHIHIYLQLNRSVRMSIAKLKGAHVEKCFGSPQQNKAYIEKDGEIIWEEGAMKSKGGKTIEEVKKMPKEERETLPATYYNIVNKINAEEEKHMNIDDWHKEIKVHYIYGESGIGKSKMAAQEIKKLGGIFNLIKFDGSFWHGVTSDTDIALYDDWRDSHMKPNEFINLIDYNKHPMNIKGGTVLNNYKHIFITTVQSPEEIYGNVQGEPRLQWERRIEFIRIERPAA